RRTETVDIGRRAELIELSGSLFRAHELGRSQGASGNRGLDPTARCGYERRTAHWFALTRGVVSPDSLGKPPVDNKRLAVRPEHDVGRLEVAMQNAPAMGIRDRVA